MNILADKQQQLFDSNISEKECEIRKKNFYELYYRLREQNERSLFGRLTFRQRSLLHPLMYIAYKINAFVNGLHFQIIGDRHTSVKRPIIFAITHQSKFDIEVIGGAIPTHMYLLTGDYERIQGTANACLLGINGVFYVNETDKRDRALVKEKMIKHLQMGGNIMYYPEGNWNLSESVPVQPLFWGIVEIARRSNAVIVPVAMERYNKQFDINIGENIDLNCLSFSTFSQTEAIRILRDTLASLKWEIWERYKISCDEAAQIDWNSIINARLAEWLNFDKNCVERMLFKSPTHVEFSVAFAHLSRLIPNHRNAFLFNKRNHN